MNVFQRYLAITATSTIKKELWKYLVGFVFPKFEIFQSGHDTQSTEHSNSRNPNIKTINQIRSFKTQKANITGSLAKFIEPDCKSSNSTSLHPS